MINQNIKDLSEKVLGSEEINKISKIINGITNGNRKDALNELVEVLGRVPKRPLYYIAYEITGLPEYGTRDIIRYSGDYIDQLVKFTLEDKRFLSRLFSSSLGPNIGKLKKFIDSDFYDKLVLFNIIYSQAKHDFNHEEDKSLFNYRDAVYVIFITKKLSGKLVDMSESARDYNSGGIGIK